MKVGVFTALYDDLPLEVVLDKLAALGVETVELGTGNYPGNGHCDPDELLGSESKRRALLDALDSRGLAISALSQHGNPLHPRDEVAARSHETWRKTARLAELLEVETVIAFSGCPGDAPGASHPNWVTCAWPGEYGEVLEWQWNERVVPYWRHEVEVARSHGVRVAVEPHPGFVVYDPDTLLRLRDATGPELGANYDPSHLFWQGIDPVVAVEALAAAGALFHVHAKDTRLNPELVARRGVLETTSLALPSERSWNFATVGDGHGAETWQAIVDALRRNGYDGPLSLEHEDPLMGLDEGLARGVAFVRRLLPPART